MIEERMTETLKYDWKTHFLKKQHQSKTAAEEMYIIPSIKQQEHISHRILY